MSLAHLSNPNMGRGTYAQIEVRMDYCPDPIWHRMKVLKNFTMKDVVALSPQGAADVVIDYIKRCIKGQYVIAVDGAKTPDKEDIYSLVRPEQNAPFLDIDGKLSRTSRIRENIWRTIGMLKVFNVRQVASSAHAGTDAEYLDYKNVQRYLNALEDAGFIELINFDERIYSIVGEKVIGPEAPMLCTVDFLYNSREAKVISHDPVAEEVFI